MRLIVPGRTFMSGVEPHCTKKRQHSAPQSQTSQGGRGKDGSNLFSTYWGGRELIKEKIARREKGGR